MVVLPGDSPALRKARGAFFTPEPIADHLASWAVRGDPHSTVLDPTCGEAVFLLAAAKQLLQAGATPDEVGTRLFGIDLHQASLDSSATLLDTLGVSASFVCDDFFAVPTPDQLGSEIPLVDAVIGNPPFVRYQQHTGATRKLSTAAALRQGVRINGLASSWAASLVHSCGFLKPNGRLAMVLPAELLTVGYAEPIRRWLRNRFEKVHLVMFERLQFSDALEKVVLLLAEGSGGCDAFSLYHVEDSADLERVDPYTNWSVIPTTDSKWTDLLLPNRQRRVFKAVSDEFFVPLSRYGTPELGIVTGNNSYFTLTEGERINWGIGTNHLSKISPPGSKHFQGLTFSAKNWNDLRDSQAPVWLFRPDSSTTDVGVRKYIAFGEESGVQDAYKCRIRAPWWRPPTVPAPDFFFTYMSHRYPRLIQNTANVTFLNSMHGVRLNEGTPEHSKSMLPLLCLNSVTMLGAELFGRSYGGGILKMEPREASILPLPNDALLEVAWRELHPHRATLERQLRGGRWTDVVKRVDAAVLGAGAGLKESEIATLLQAARSLRARRMGREGDSSGASK